ncbi:hypothetical protein [Pseudoxanthomonas sp.]|uniref:hypothetical protein n=1 Tax=Pseudoxanthomonas sp. TaxID=1871049 RepID=UPI00258915BE|nr:hypothetical protein [Pseudoxanthomonas sp.]MCR6687394.1 hypothetical protein [Pseudoxanthomonas sp.]
MTPSPDHRNASDRTASARDEADARQDTAQQQEKQALEQHRRQPSPSEEQVRREQGGTTGPSAATRCRIGGRRPIRRRTGSFGNAARATADASRRTGDNGASVSHR